MGYFIALAIVFIICAILDERDKRRGIKRHVPKHNSAGYLKRDGERDS